MTMRPSLRPLAPALLAVLAGVAVSGCGGSGAGLIPTANAGTLEHDFEEVALKAQAGNGDCSATRAALEKAEGDLFSLPEGINGRLRARLGQGVSKLHEVALARCAQRTTTSSTTSTTKTTTALAPVTESSTTESLATTTHTTQAATTPPEEGPPGGGTPAPEGEGNGPGGGGAEGGGGHESHGLGGGR